MTKKEKLLVFLLALVISFSLYGNTIGGKFVFDDQMFNSRPELRHPSYVKNIFLDPYLPSQPEAGIYRPLIFSSFALNYYFFGDSPVSFRIVNIFLNGGVMFLVFLLAFELTKSRKFSYLSFLIFSFLPIHTEVVSFIKSRDEIFSLFFILLTLLFFYKNKQVLSSFFLLLALFSKEFAIIVPLVILYILVTKNWPDLGKIARKFSFYIPSFAVYLFFRYLALGRQFAFGGNETDFIYNPLKFSGAGERIFTSLKVAFLYLQKIVVPYNLSADYFYNYIKIISNPFQSYQSVLGALIIAGLIYLAVRFRRNIVGISAVICLFPYLMVSNLFFSIGGMMGERWAYFPSIGFSFLAAHLVTKVSKPASQKLVYGLIGLVLVIYGAVILNRNKVWLSNSALYQNMLKVSPDSVLTRNNMAYLYFENGYIDEAKKEADIAIGIHPFAPTFDLLGEIYLKEKIYAEAEEFFKRSIELNPKTVTSYHNLAQMYYDLKRYRDAVEILKYPLDFMPLQKAVLIYSISQMELGNYQEAIDMILKNYGEHPQKDRFRLALGLAYLKQKNYPLAKEYLKEFGYPAVAERKLTDSLKRF